MATTEERLRALLDAASLRPWGAVGSTREALKGWPIGFECGGDDEAAAWAVSVFGRHASEGPTRGAGNDARLIAAAANALPALLAVVAAARVVAEAGDSELHWALRDLSFEIGAMDNAEAVKP